MKIPWVVTVRQHQVGKVGERIAVGLGNLTAPYDPVRQVLEFYIKKCSLHVIQQTSETVAMVFARVSVFAVVSHSLRERGDVPEEVVRAVAAHAPERTGVEPETDLDRVLFACDELAGFINACALVRPQRLEGLTPKSVEKRLKSPTFAAGVSRADVNRGMELLGVDRAAHITRVIAAMQTIAPELGLEPAEG
jgi:hypothetical protein